jgi:hypothetical protein
MPEVKHYEHGDLGRYKRDGCRCQECRDAQQRRRKQTDLRRKTEGPALTPSKEVGRMIRQLNKQGWSYERMGKATGIAGCTLWRIARGKQGPFTSYKTRLVVQTLWDDVFCDGTMLDLNHPTRLRGNVQRGSGRWDLREIVRRMAQRYGHNEGLCPEDRDELNKTQLASTRMAEKLAIKHGFMPWDVWPDWDSKVRV